MKYLLLLLIMCIATGSLAEVYRSVDSHGNVIFSDQPSDNAEKIELKSLSTYTPVPIPVVTEAIETEEEDSEDLVLPDYQINIVSPQQNENLWENAGKITIRVNITPELNAEREDKLIFKLDGKSVSEPQSATDYTLDQVDRGSHIAVVSIVDKSGKVIRSSKSILFHLHRRSVAQ